MFRRVLIANRGEIAIRVARAASALGVESVSVYATVDALSLHTRVTTESRALSASRAHSSDPVRAYLDIEALIECAKAISQTSLGKFVHSEAQSRKADRNPCAVKAAPSRRSIIKKIILDIGASTFRPGKMS